MNIRKYQLLHHQETVTATRFDTYIIRLYQDISDTQFNYLNLLAPSRAVPFQDTHPRLLLRQALKRYQHVHSNRRLAIVPRLLNWWIEMNLTLNLTQSTLSLYQRNPSTEPTNSTINIQQLRQLQLLNYPQTYE
jgi:hypothetical protein